MSTSELGGHLGESLDRVKRFDRELSRSDPATRAHLLGAWKEQVIEDCVSVLRSTNDPQCISNIDRAIAIIKDLVGFGRITQNS